MLDTAAVADRVSTTTTLNKYFRFRLYGTEARNQADMVRQAIEKAETLTGIEFKRYVIIGDSIRDIECGKQFHALTIAVAAGFHSEKKLVKHKPDCLFKNLGDYKRVLQVIG
jgi:phosphoglycolate phosphatase-like HAD superfamily hydrolase